jgi:hypothetical protein
MKSEASVRLREREREGERDTHTEKASKMMKIAMRHSRTTAAAHITARLSLTI